MSRRIVAGLGIALALTVASSASAQLGGLVKKAKDKAAASAGVQQSSDQPARLPGPEITGDVVSRFLVALKAEKAAKDRNAANEERRKKADEEREKKAAVAAMDPTTRHMMCTQEKMHADPKYADFEKLSKTAEAAARSGDNNKMMEAAVQISPLQTELQQRADSLCALEESKAAKEPKPSAEQDAVQNAPESSPEESGAKAGGFTMADYGQIKELIYTHLNYGKRAGLTDPEKKAVDPKAKELKDAFKAIGMG
jgi:hypothetical protein